MPIEDLKAWFQARGFDEQFSLYAAESVELLIVVALAFVANLIAKRIILQLVRRLVAKTKTNWDDIMVRRLVFQRLSHIVPAVVIFSMAPVVFETPSLVSVARVASQVYMLIVGLLVIDAALTGVDEIYQQFPVSKRIPIRGYLQVVKLIFSLAALIVSISLIIDKSPLLLLSGLGAMTAVLLLIFRDTILGLVAGIQLVAYDMVRPGDWIEMPSNGVDGDVEDITLNIVKIRNFDKTVVTIPTYKLIAESFKNWRGMSESGGRRIKRSILVDINSVDFCRPELLEELSKIQSLKRFIDERWKEIEAENAEQGVDDSSPANGRRLTNVGLFRHYVEAYLRSRNDIHSDMTFLVRQLAPGPQGLPLEIYVFSSDQRWVQYEGIQSDIFDHLLAVMPLFELRAFQQPSGPELADAAKAITSH